MKHRAICLFTLGLMAALPRPAAVAANLFWDPLQNNTGKGTNNWTSANVWDTGALGGGAATWTNGDTANFTPPLTGSIGTVSLSGAVSAVNLNVGLAGADVTISTADSSVDSLTVTGTANLTGGLALQQVFGSTTDVRYTFSGAGITGGGQLSLAKVGNAGTNLFIDLTGPSTTIGPAGSSITVGAFASGLAGVVSRSAGATLQRNITNISAATTFLGASSGNTLTVSGAGAGANGTSTIQVGSSALSLNGTVAVGAGASLVSSNTIGIDINAGTLLLNASEVIGNTTNVRLSGGTLEFGTFGLTENAGALTLSANSVIDFGAFGASGNTLKFTSANLGAFTLSIWNYTPGVDHLFFGTSSTGSGLAGAVLVPTPFGTGPAPGSFQIKFFSDEGQTPFFGGGPTEGGAFLPPSLALSGQGEIVPVPEPNAVLSVVLLIFAIGWKERRLFAPRRSARAA